MDNIYEDLENYNDAEEIARLRSENQALKLKIEEYAKQIKELKQDLERLTDEYHKLQLNYSSLLKTAKQEIERKTQTITNLNIDKDVMVINYVEQNKNRNILRRKPYCNCPCIHNKIEKDGSKTVRDKPKKNIEKDMSKKSLETENQKKSSEKEIPSLTKCKLDVKSPEEKKAKEDKKMILKDIKTSEKSLSTPNVVLETKEEKRDSISEVKNKPVVQKNIEIKVEKKPLSIKDRRKSMPILSVYPVNINSDDENDLNNFREKKRNCPSKDNSDRWLVNTNGSIKDRKTSKALSSEEKSSYYHELSKTHRTRYNTRWEKERSFKDKYSRRYSPERHTRRENQYQKFEKRRTRVLISPPKEKYDKCYSKKYKESRRHYDRPQPYDFDRHRYYDDKPAKHKLPIDYEEPLKKRPKFESQRRYTKEVEDNFRYEMETESDSLAETLEQLESQFVSCQSPDYVQMEAMTSHPLKEIRETASSPLEDPRETSKRYIIRFNDKGKTILTTVVGRNVEIKLINRENWCLPKVNVPEPLVNIPLKNDHEIIKDIYAAIDDVDLVDNLPVQFVERQEPLDKPNTHENIEMPKNSSLDHKLGDELKDRIQTENSTQVTQNKYRIPKMKKCDNKVIDVGNVNKNKSEDSPCIATEASENTHKEELCKIFAEKEQPLTFMNTNNENVEFKNKDLDIDKLISHNIEHHVSVRGIVEGDLELSDETSDNTEVRHLIVNKTTQHIDNTIKDQEIFSNNNQTNNKEISKEIKVTPPGKPRRTPNSNKKESKKDESSKRVSPVSITTSRGKKKNHKQKDLKEAESCSKPVQQEKKMRSKKDKDPKETNTSNKFKDLFGTDSNSLITPEDLGLAPNKVPTDKYVPLFEDAQDATDVEQIAKVKQDLMDIEKRLKPKNNEISFKSNSLSVNNIEELKHCNINLVPPGKLNTCNDMPTINSTTVTECLLTDRTIGIASVSVGEPTLINRTAPLTPTTVINPILTDQYAGKVVSCVVNPIFKNKPAEESAVCANNSTLIDRTVYTTPATSSGETIVTTDSNSIFTDRTTGLVTVNVDNSRITGTSPATVVNSIHKIESGTSVSVASLTIIDSSVCKSPTIFSIPTPAAISKYTDTTTINALPETVKHTVIDRTSCKASATVTNPALIDTVVASACVTTADHSPIVTPMPSSTYTSKTDYINLNPGKSNQSDVVKTVIISSGIQPQCVECPVNTRIQPLVVNVEHLDDAMSNEFKYKNIETMKALATSTPYKEKSTPEPALKANDSINGSNNVNKACVVTEQSESSVSVSQNETDIPDVRIFVQRRRKIRKKPVT